MATDFHKVPDSANSSNSQASQRSSACEGGQARDNVNATYKHAGTPSRTAERNNENRAHEMTPNASPRLVYGRPQATDLQLVYEGLEDHPDVIQVLRDAGCTTRSDLIHTPLQALHPCRANWKAELLAISSMNQIERFLKQNKLTDLLTILEALEIQTLAELEEAINLGDEGPLAHVAAATQARLAATLTRKDPAATRSDKQERVCADKIHGTIRFPRWIWEHVIDSRPVQRLRHLKQLGTTQWIFPCGQHTRFEHSIGVGHLASQWFNMLRKKSNLPNAGYMQILNDSVTIGGILHDLGHGPFSHAFEHQFARPVVDRNWRHEDWSVRLYRWMLDDAELGLGSIVDNFGTGKLIENIMVGNPPPRQPNRDILTDQAIRELDMEVACTQIVANRTTGCDVDRFDYLLRDCTIAEGLPAFDCARVMKFSDVLPNEGICFNYLIRSEIFGLFHARFNMFGKVYCHRKSQAIGEMIGDYFQLMDPVLKLSEILVEEDVERYLQLDDRLLGAHVPLLAVGGPIVAEFEPRIRQAAAIIERLEKRQLYSFVAEIPLATVEELQVGREVSANPEQAISEILALVPHPGSVQRKDILVKVHKHDYGAPEINPWDSIKFYSPVNTLESAFPLPAKFKGSFPSRWFETALRVFSPSRNPATKTEIQKALTRWIRVKGIQGERGDGLKLADDRNDPWDPHTPVIRSPFVTTYRGEVPGPGSPNTRRLSSRRQGSAAE